MECNKLNIGLFLVILILFSCNDLKTNIVENKLKSLNVQEQLLELRATEGLVYYKNIPFTGNAIKLYSKDKIAARTNYLKGKKEGLLEKRFEDGSISFRANYKNGKLNGFVKSWWKNGNLRSESQFDNGIANGLQKQWYKSGNKFKDINLANGKEEGMQKSWRENGKLYNNYEAKNGRIFGLKRASLCFQLEDEKVITNN